MLRRLSLGCWSNASTLSHLRCQRSTLVVARSVSDHLVPGSGDADPAAAFASPAASKPRWAILNHRVNRRDESIVPDAKNVADCRTFAFGGGQFRVSMSLAPPSENSFLYYDWTGSAELEPRQFVVTAAHGDSVLLDAPYTGVCFVYRAGAATRPPSLSQVLPARDAPPVGKRLRVGDKQMVGKQNTGLLRRGENDEVLVVQLELTPPRADMDTFLAEVRVLHASTREWELKQAVPVVYGGERDGDGGKGDRPWRSSLSLHMGNKVVGVGDRFVCWVNYDQGFVLVCDMAEESRRPSKLRYVPLPMPVVPFDSDVDKGIEYSRDICGVTIAGAGALKFVSIDRRCCCCSRSSNAFLVTTWTLDLRTDDDDGPMAWVKDAALESEELLALPGYDGLPRVRPAFPVVSLDNPDVVCFKVDEAEFDRFEEREIWMVEVDMRNKALLSSAVRCARYSYFDSHVPVKLHY